MHETIGRITLPLTVTLQSFLFLCSFSVAAKFSFELFESLRCGDGGVCEWFLLRKGVLSTSNMDLTFDFFSGSGEVAGFGGGVSGSTLVLFVRVRCVTLTGCAGVEDARSNDSMLDDTLSAGVGRMALADGSLTSGGGVVRITKGVSSSCASITMFLSNNTPRTKYLSARLCPERNSSSLCLLFASPFMVVSLSIIVVRIQPRHKSKLDPKIGMSSAERSIFSMRLIWANFVSRTP